MSKNMLLTLAAIGAAFILLKKDGLAAQYQQQLPTEKKPENNTMTQAGVQPPTSNGQIDWGGIAQTGLSFGTSLLAYLNTPSKDATVSGGAAQDNPTTISL